MVLSAAKKKRKKKKNHASPGSLGVHTKNPDLQGAWGEFRDPSKRGNMMNLSPPRARFCSVPEAGKK